MNLPLSSFIKLYKKGCADADYGSEENYAYMETNGIEAYVKYNYFHKEQKRAFKDDIFRIENLCYNADGDYYVCPMGQHMERVGTRHNKPEAVFGQMKYNMQYKRFRHFSKDKVTMDFAFLAIAFNIKKMIATMKRAA